MGIIYWPGMAQMSAVIPFILVASQPQGHFVTFLKASADNKLCSQNRSLSECVNAEKRDIIVMQ